MQAVEILISNATWTGDASLESYLQEAGNVIARSISAVEDLKSGQSEDLDSLQAAADSLGNVSAHQSKMHMLGSRYSEDNMSQICAYQAVATWTCLI